jgi:chromate transporter
MTNNSTVVTATAAPCPQVGLLTILRVYLVVGLTAFGLAILQKLKKVVLSHHWLTEEEMNDGLAMVQLYPGPIMVNFTTYVGYRLRGTPGALMAALGFISPSIVLMILLAAAYFAAGSLPWVAPLFVGLEALVVGVVFNVTLDFGQRALKGRIHALIALAAFAALTFKLNAVLIVLAALVIGALLLQPKAQEKGTTGGGASTTARPPAGWSGWVGIGATAAIVLAVVALTWFTDGDVGRLGRTFFKIGAVAFGNGMTILPLVQADAVDAHHWLTMPQFADGIALSQITPGPFLNIAALIGYKVGGVWGALLATFAMFSPSFIWTLIFSETYGYVRDVRAVKGALAGVLAGFVGLLIVVVLQLGSVGITGPASLTMAAAAFVAVRFFKLDILWVFSGGLLLWGGLLAVGLI